MLLFRHALLFPALCVHFFLLQLLHSCSSTLVFTFSFHSFPLPSSSSFLLCSSISPPILFLVTLVLFLFFESLTFHRRLSRMTYLVMWNIGWWRQSTDRDRQTDRQTDKQTDSQKRQTQTYTHRHAQTVTHISTQALTHIQTHTYTQTHRQTDRERQREERKQRQSKNSWRE